MSRFVIRNKQGLLYTYNFVPETVWAPDPANPAQNRLVSKLVPMFETTHPIMALKYEERVDAASILHHPDLDDPDAFEGCEVVEVEFDSKNHSAMR